MHALVLGAGSVGIATAWFLRDHGWDVTVIDRRDRAASETSYANAGIVAASYATPWAAPGMIGKALAGWFKAHPPLVIRPRLDAAMLRWLLRFRANCAPERFLANKAAMQRVAGYSAQVLVALAQYAGVSYARADGYLQLFRDRKSLAAAKPGLAVLDKAGVAYRLVDPAGCLEIEPGLAHRNADLAGGLYLETDQVGDSRGFTRALAARLAERGVRFVWNARIEAIDAAGGKFAGVRLTGGAERADAAIVALGPESPRHLAPLGIAVPVYPVKGYSLTLPIRDEAAAPRAALMDEATKVAISRIGDRLRFAGTAELAGFDLSIPAARQVTLRHVMNSWFPRAADAAAGEYWTGLRPMTPDGPPILGATPVAGLYLNLGHGSQGWTQAWGSGKALADLVTGRTPEIDLAPYAWDRYR